MMKRIVSKMWGNDFRGNRLWVIISWILLVGMIGYALISAGWQTINIVQELPSDEKSNFIQGLPTFLFIDYFGSVVLTGAILLLVNSFRERKPKGSALIKAGFVGSILFTVFLPLSFLGQAVINESIWLNTIFNATFASFIVSTICLVVRKVDFLKLITQQK